MAPGTWGSFGASATALIAYWLFPDAISYEIVLVGLAALAVFGCVVLGDWAVAFYGSKDPRQVVLDEAAGQFVALMALPHLGVRTMLAVVALQFLLFRIADIVKPPPARQLERLPAGWGIVCDDLAAGLYANIAGQLLLRWLQVIS